MNFFRQVKDSITDPKFYTTIYNQGFGKTFKYLFLLFLLTFIINGASFSAGFLGGIDRFAAEVQAKVPDFKLANGQLTVSGQQPIMLQNEDTTVIIDTTGKTSRESLAQKPGDFMLITKDQIVTRQGIKTQEISFAQVPLSLDKSQMANLIPYFKLFLVIVGIFALVFGIIGTLLWTLILAVGALVISASVKTDLKFSQLYNISAYALTLPVILELVKQYVPEIPFFSLIFWGIGLLYVYQALKVIKNEQPLNPVDDPDLKV